MVLLLVWWDSGRSWRATWRWLMAVADEQNALRDAEKRQ